MPKILTKQEWISKVSTIHNNWYDYSKTEYIAARYKVIITCPIHGDFEQKANHHMSGHGCRFCANKSISSALRKDLDIFIEDSIKIHGNKYDYSKVKYNTCKDPVCIICYKHGEFWQTPDSHINGKSGCQKCFDDIRGNSLAKSNEEFMAEAINIHKDLYDYSKVEYINSNSKVIIICRTHGEFLQTPASHLTGSGCPICNNSKGELLIYNWLKENNIRFRSQFELITPEIARNTNLMRIDFFVIHNDNQYFIEYDGLQHFEYIPHFHKGGIIDFEKQQNRDRILNEFCELHKDKVTLIRFNYKQNKEEIKNILKVFFN